MLNEDERKVMTDSLTGIFLASQNQKRESVSSAPGGAHDHSQGEGHRCVWRRQKVLAGHARVEEALANGFSFSIHYSY